MERNPTTTSAHDGPTPIPQISTRRLRYSSFPFSPPYPSLSFPPLVSTLLPEKMALSMIWNTVSTPPTMAIVLQNIKARQRSASGSRVDGRRMEQQDARRDEVRERLPLLGVDDEHRRNLVVEEDAGDAGRSVRGGVALSVLLALVVRGQVSLVRSDRVLRR